MTTSKGYIDACCEAMRDGHFTASLGGEGKAVEIDETFVGGKKTCLRMVLDAMRHGKDKRNGGH